MILLHRKLRLDRLPYHTFQKCLILRSHTSDEHEPIKSILMPSSIGRGVEPQPFGNTCKIHFLYFTKSSKLIQIILLIIIIYVYCYNTQMFIDIDENVDSITYYVHGGIMVQRLFIFLQESQSSQITVCEFNV